MENFPSEIQELFQLRLWHELTEQLHQMPNEALYAAWPTICQYSDRLNQIQLVILAQKAISHLDSKAARAFLEDLQVVEQQGRILLRTTIGKYQLDMGSLAEAEEILTGCQSEVDSLNDLEPVLYSQLYLELARLHKAKGDPELFYRYSLQYLAYTPPESVRNAEDLAYELGVAVILAENIYNIGELVDQPILKSLENSQNAWLYELLHSFNVGDISKVQERLATVPNELKGEAVLRKARILAIMEHIFMQGTWIFTFEELARTANTDLDNVEWLLMKAMALGLIRGEIDEVDKVVRISWLQPKVLDNSRINMLQERIGLWKHSIHSVLTHIENQSKEILE